MLQTAIGFVPRTVLPLLGREASESEDEDETLDRDDLVRLANEAVALLQTLSSGDFDGASSRVIRHAAGAAELRQDAISFATTFALPNFFFHLSMAFAILRQGGANIGKEDFDGQHRYAADFHF